MDDTQANTPKAAFIKLLLNETRLAWRLPTGLLVGLGMPILLLVIFGSIPALNQHSAGLAGLSYFEISFPILLSVTVLSLSFVVLPARLVQYREQGILRRLSTTPVPPSWLLGAQVVVSLCMALVGMVILFAIGMIVFGLSAPKEVGAAILGIFLTITAFFAIGLCIAAIARSSAAAQAFGGLLFYPMLFFSGIWLPRESMPIILRNISGWTPAGASVGAIQNAMQGTAIEPHLLIALFAYSLACGYVAVRYFRWE
jgi:ABC-2 type transport system permease protein